jgi:REP element-mobilizing transposase RayT
MGRAPRIDAAEAVQHVTARGVRKLPIYHDDIDCARFRSLVLAIARKLAWRCHAYCLMPNHFHLLVETEHPNLSVGMHRLNWRYALSFNTRHGYEGHLFERRFYSAAIESEAHFLETARYIALNPVRAGLCRHPGEWKLSSYRGTIGTAMDDLLNSDRLLGCFGRDRHTARRRYARFVAEGVDLGRVLVPGTGTRLNQPKPYVPAKRSANRRTRRAAGRPTTFR